jgi:XTP/dITP diphosphohydrolase
MAHIAPSPQETPTAAFDRLLKVLHTLRTECPWDKKQTMESLRHLTIEEMYELGDAIIDQDLPEVKKELGDLMMHLVFYARIAEEQNEFNITDVLNGVCDKLIARHPHIYGDVVAESEEEVKKKEGNKSVLSGVPRSLPSMVKAFRIQDKVKGVGFDWEHSDQVWAKVEEEIQEFKQESDPERAEEEFGDLLFALINYGRHRGINPENALERTNKKFIKRFTYLEEKANESGKILREMSLAEMDVYWEEAKKLQGK